MKIKYVVASVFSLLAGQSVAQTVSPDTVTRVELSNTDSNRVVCVNGKMNDVFFSSDKIQEVPLNAKNGFIKFPILKIGNIYEYVTKRSEFHFVCNGETYTIVSEPSNTQPKIVYLGNKMREGVKKNVDLMSGMPLEKQGVMMLEKVYSNTVPASFSDEIIDDSQLEWNENLIESAGIALKRKVTARGVGLTLKEYVLVSDVKQYLDEKRFISKAISSSIFQITVTPKNVSAGERARVFVVERVGSNNGY